MTYRSKNAGQPAFGSGWKNAAGGAQVAGFYEDDEGVVHLRGVVDMGSVVTILTLPAGYRPAATESFTALVGTSSLVTIVVVASGDVDLEFLSGPGGTISCLRSRLEPGCEEPAHPG